MLPAPIEQALVAYLEPLVGSTVRTRVPNPRPDTFVRLTRVGGDRQNLVQGRPRVLIECWGNTDILAWTLAEDAYDALDRLNDEGDLPRVSIHRVELTEPVNYPDAQSASPRYQFIATITANLKEKS